MRSWEDVSRVRNSCFTDNLSTDNLVFSLLAPLERTLVIRVAINTKSNVCFSANLIGRDNLINQTLTLLCRTSLDDDSIAIFNSLKNFSELNVYRTRSLVEENLTLITTEVSISRSASRSTCECDCTTTIETISITRNLQNVVQEYQECCLSINLRTCSCPNSNRGTTSLQREGTLDSIKLILNQVKNLKFTKVPCIEGIRLNSINRDLELFKSWTRYERNSCSSTCADG